MTRRRLTTLLALTIVAMLAVAAADQVKPWKRLQLEHLAARQTALTTYLEEMDLAQADEIRLLREGVGVAEEALQGRRRERRDLERNVFRLERQLRRAQGRLAKAGDPEEAREARLEVEAYAEMVRESRTSLEVMLADLHRAQADLSAAEEKTAAQRHELAELRRDRWRRLLPGIRHLAPNLGVRETSWTEASGAARRDRCVTCHMAMSGTLTLPDLITRPEVATRAHPRPDLLGPGAPHTVDAVGCTSCHGGDGASTDLARSGHLPKDAATAERWRRDWGWRRSEVNEPILSGALIEAGCGSCHEGDVWPPGAPSLERGRRLVARLGCAACHAGSEGQAEPTAPDLSGLHGRTPRAWLARYLADPRSARPGSTKALYWADVSPMDRQVEIEALVSRIWGPAEPERSGPPSSPQAGDPETGSILFERLACGACHVPGSEMAGHGPNLEGLVERRRPSWVSTFLTGEATAPEIHRPGLGLSATEASHLAAFLLAQDPQSPTRDDAPTSIDEGLRDHRLLHLLERETTLEGAQATLEALHGSERSVALGDRLIRLYGCAQCHAIPGARSPGGGPPVAGDLSRIGEALARRLERGDRPPTGWFHHQASFPADAALLPGDPGLTAGDSQALFVELLGWRGDSEVRAPSGTAFAGRAVMERHDCRACHPIDGEGGADTGETADLSLDRLAPRLRPDWVTDFLGRPQERPVRRWMDARMPHFELSPEELDAVAGWFATKADVPRTSETPPERDPLAEAVGGVVFTVLQCERCHGLGPRPREEISDGDEGLPPIHLAPDYRLSAERLRPGWVRAFLLDPHGLDPETAMPPLFPSGPDGKPDASYLVGSLQSPLFDLHRQRLNRLFESEEELWAYLSDPERTARAVRAHLFALAEP